MFASEPPDRAADARRPFRRLLAVATLAAASIGAAIAYGECTGCGVQAPNQMPGSDPCWSGIWIIDSLNGSCSWDAPNCVANEPCAVDFTWTVVPASSPPASCPSSATFSWAATWGTGSSASGSTQNDRAQALENLRLPCGSYFQITVVNGATLETVMEFAATCTPCLGN